MLFSNWHMLYGLLIYVVWSEALKEGDVGVCVEPPKERKPRMGITTYLCNGGRRCTSAVKKMPEKPSIMCCDDYEFDESRRVCKPLCLDGCVGGNCTAPDVCTCQPPLVLAINRCVAPTCDNPCVHGECTAPNTCTCNPGYYLQEDNFTCVPQCTNCTNGICEVPNVCKCNPGYQKTEGGTCVPECNNCSNGHCDTPNACKCNVNYEMSEGNCKPVCKTPCVNGTCISPDTCECLEGYKRGARKEVCEPKCNSCVHGDCVAPNECRCLKGYAIIDGVCAPICRDTCVNGNCSAPNECICNEGYIQNITNPFICYKPCVDCNQGTCNREGECICEEEFELINGTCTVLTPVMAGIATTPGLAGLEVSWLVGGGVGLLLVILLVVALERSWRRRKDLGRKTGDADQPYSSVAFTTTNTLIRKNDAAPTEIPGSDEEDTSEALMAQENNIV